MQIYVLYSMYPTVQNQSFSALEVQMLSANQSTAFPATENNMTETTSRPLVASFHFKEIKAAKVCCGIMGVCLRDAVSPVAFHLELTFLTIHTHQCQKLYQVLQQSFYICLKGYQSASALRSYMGSLGSRTPSCTEKQSAQTLLLDT